MVFCDANKYVCGMKTRFESSQGASDDTALNGIVAMCCDNSNSGTNSTQQITVETGNWGTWDNNFTMCPTGQYTCGMNWRFEGDNAVDDTAANGVSMQCCDL